MAHVVTLIGQTYSNCLAKKRINSSVERLSRRVSNAARGLSGLSMLLYCGTPRSVARRRELRAEEQHDGRKVKPHQQGRERTRRAERIRHSRMREVEREQLLAARKQ